MHAAIFRCYDAGIPTPRPVPNKNGDYFTLEKLSTRKGSDGNGKLMCLLYFCFIEFFIHCQKTIVLRQPLKRRFINVLWTFSVVNDFDLD